LDLFFYGSQDVPPPLGGGGGPPEPPGVCEACSAPVQPADIEAGRARSVYGLVLCERCAQRTRPEDRIELYFCDRCQVSVPVYRVDTGEALAGDGRILCVACRERGPRLVGPRVLLTVLFLLAVSVLSFVLLGPDRSAPPVKLDPLPPRAILHPARPTGGPDAAAIAAERSRHRRLERIHRSLEETEAGLAEAVGRLEEAKRELESFGERVRRRMDVLERESVELDRRVEGRLSEAEPLR